MPFRPGSPSCPPDRRPAQRVNSFREFGQSITRSTSKAVTNLSQTTRDAMNADLPTGAWAAAAEASSKAPTLSEIRRGSFAASGWIHGGQPRRTVDGETTTVYEATTDTACHGSGSYDTAEIQEKQQLDGGIALVGASSEHDRILTTTTTTQGGRLTPSSSESLPKIPWTRSTIIGLRAFW